MTPAERSQSQAFKLIEREGSAYTNRPADRGGPTKFGITLGTLARYRRAPVTSIDVENLTQNEAVQIYITLFMTRSRFDQIRNDHIFDLVVDSAVQHGQARAAKWLQRAAGCKVIDSIVGPLTIAAVNAGNPQQIFDSLVAERKSFYAQIVENDPTQKKFELGWENRMAQFAGRKVALA